MSSRAGAIVISAKAQEWMKAQGNDDILRDVYVQLTAYAEAQRFARYTSEQLAELETKYQSLLTGIKAAKENATA